jgi:hypothetical protein
VGADSLFQEFLQPPFDVLFTHNAHYDAAGFYATWFTSDADRLRFLLHTLAWPCWGDPEFTFCDVERAIQQEIRKRNYLARYELRAAEAMRSGEMETLKRLEAKYRMVVSHQPDTDSAPSIPSSAAQEVARARMPVQASLF